MKYFKLFEGFINESGVDRDAKLKELIAMFDRLNPKASPERREEAIAKITSNLDSFIELKREKPAEDLPKVDKILTLGDWFSRELIDPKKVERYGINWSYNFREGLIVAIETLNDEVTQVTLADVYQGSKDTVDNKQYLITSVYADRNTSINIEQLLKVTKDGVSIKYDENRANANLEKLKSNEYNQAKNNNALKITHANRKRPDGNSIIHTLVLSNINSNGMFKVDVSPLIN